MPKVAMSSHVFPSSTAQININLLLVHKFCHLLVFIVEKDFWF